MRPSQEHPKDRPQTVPNGHRSPGDRRGEDHELRPADRPQPSTTVRRITVPEAAEILGTTTDAVRSRMRRGKLRREEGEDGTVYVILEGSEAGHDADGRGTSGDGQETVKERRETVMSADGDGRQTVEDSPMVEVLRDQVEHLRSELALERESSSELRRIIAAMTQRIPVVELEAPPDEPGAHETASEGPARVSDREEDRRPQRASWWRRFFGFE